MHCGLGSPSSPASPGATATGGNGCTGWVIGRCSYSFLVNKNQNIIPKFPTPTCVSLETVQPREKDSGTAAVSKSPRIKLYPEVPPHNPRPCHARTCTEEGANGCCCDYQFFFISSKYLTGSVSNNTQPSAQGYRVQVLELLFFRSIITKLKVKHFYPLGCPFWSLVNLGL